MYKDHLLEGEKDSELMSFSPFSLPILESFLIKIQVIPY
jgi:hypothetical protein